MNKIQYNTADSVQSVTSYYGLGPKTLALTADSVLWTHQIISFVITA